MTDTTDGNDERGKLQAVAISARARGDWAAERHALDQLALLERGPVDTPEDPRARLLRILSDWESFVAGDGQTSLRMKDERTDEQIADEILAVLAAADQAAPTAHDVLAEAIRYSDGHFDPAVTAYLRMLRKARLGVAADQADNRVADAKRDALNEAANKARFDPALANIPNMSVTIIQRWLRSRAAALGGC